MAGRECAYSTASAITAKSSASKSASAATRNGVGTDRFSNALNRSSCVVPRARGKIPCHHPRQRLASPLCALAFNPGHL